ncbi:hypothetical protein DPMN_090565 [Dreissena polymorpha]|uniref:Uncharacterized protein n=1 Tax=Dreissena polymorpha TaxID=45954 RepID=A0A9D4QYB6_DREPO|nr:hypothetical protein DPMN_090565 [Dreissena polymorpha]
MNNGICRFHEVSFNCCCKYLEGPILRNGDKGGSVVGTELCRCHRTIVALQHCHLALTLPQHTTNIISSTSRDIQLTLYHLDTYFDVFVLS